jgi:hypothetical protein
LIGMVSFNIYAKGGTKQKIIIFYFVFNFLNPTNRSSL